MISHPDSLSQPRANLSDHPIVEVRPHYSSFKPQHHLRRPRAPRAPSQASIHPTLFPKEPDTGLSAVLKVRPIWLPHLETCVEITQSSVVTLRVTNEEVDSHHAGHKLVANDSPYSSLGSM